MENVDALLREYARSPLPDEDEDAEARRNQRVESLRSIEALHPGVWRERNKSA